LFRTPQIMKTAFMTNLNNYLAWCTNQTFYHCDKILKRKNLKEEGFVLTHSFRGFCPLLGYSIVSRLLRLNSMVKGHGGTK
jgi:hypothetical protein